MAGGAAEVHEPSFGQQEYFVAVRKGVLIYLRLDVRALHVLGVVERVDLNLIIEVADVGDDGLIFHPLHVIERDDVEVAGGGNVNVAAAERVLDGGDFVAFHGGLQRVDRIDLGDNDAGPLSTQ